MFEAHANPRRQHPRALGLSFSQGSTLRVGTASSITDCSSWSPTSEASSDVRPSPAHWDSLCGSRKSSFLLPALLLLPTCPCPFLEAENYLETMADISSNILPSRDSPKCPGHYTHGICELSHRRDALWAWTHRTPWSKGSLEGVNSRGRDAESKK